MKELSPMYNDIRERTKAVIEKSLGEMGFNPMRGGLGSVDVVKTVFYQPHNYRLYFHYSRGKDFFSRVSKIADSLNTRPLYSGCGVFKWINYGKELSNDNFFSCRLVVHKNSVEIVNKVNHKRWYSIELGSHADIDARFRSIASLKDGEAVKVFEKFLSLFGGKSDFSIVNARVEAKVKGDDVIDLLPSNMVFHGDVAKKVYNEKNVEFKNEGLAANYLKNRALEDFTPEIAAALKDIRDSLSGRPLVSALESLKMDVKVFPDDVVNNKVAIESLSDGDKSLFTEWLFSEFGGGLVTFN